MMRFVGWIEKGQLASNPSPERYAHCQLLWRGFISNADDLVREANRRGHQVDASAIGELFSLAYLWWGEGLQAHVIGEYSLAILDNRSSRLLLTHDAFGLVPMFYRATPTGVTFGSHLEDLVDGADREDLDEEYIADYIAGYCYPSERTPFRAIRRVSFGHSIVIEANEIIDRRTWSFGAPMPKLADDREYEERFVALLTQAVAGALRARAPVWTELSGGLDSSTIACFAARSGARNLEAISLTYNRYAQADESKWMKLLLDVYPISWTKVEGDDLLPFSELPDRFCAEPGSPMVEWAWHRRRESLVKKAGAGALLTGQGGDFVLFGLGAEPYYLADLVRTVKLARLWSELSNWSSADRQKRSTLFWLVHFGIRPLSRYLRDPPQRPGKRPILSPWIEPQYATGAALVERAGRTFPGDYQSVEQCWLIDTLVKTCGRIARLNQQPASFEFRHPLLHRPLVEFLFSLPSEQKFNPKMNRFLQRRALESFLPEPLRLRSEKTIYDQPYYEGLRKGKAWTDLLTTNPRIAKRGIVNGAAWIDAVGQARLGRTHSLAQFEAAATLEIWLRQLENRPTLAPKGCAGPRPWNVDATVQP